MSASASAPRRRTSRNYLVLVLAPPLLLPLLTISDPPQAGRAAWATALIAVYWATEAMPIAITSLLPLVLFPLLGVAPADRVSRNYFADKIVLFFGGLVIAGDVELADAVLLVLERDVVGLVIDGGDG